MGGERGDEVVGSGGFQRVFRRVWESTAPFWPDTAKNTAPSGSYLTKILVLLIKTDY